MKKKQKWSIEFFRQCIFSKTSLVYSTVHTIMLSFEGLLWTWFFCQSELNDCGSGIANLWAAIPSFSRKKYKPAKYTEIPVFIPCSMYLMWAVPGLRMNLSVLYLRLKLTSNALIIFATVFCCLGWYFLFSFLTFISFLQLLRLLLLVCSAIPSEAHRANRAGFSAVPFPLLFWHCFMLFFFF